METKTHVGFWICAFLALFLLTPVMRNGPSMEEFVKREVELTRDAFGPGVASWLQQRASVVYNLYTPSGSFEDVEVRGDGMRRTERVVPGPGVAFTRAYNAYVHGLVLNCFVLSQRLFIFLVCFGLLVPVFVATVIDGFVQRAIKRAEFGAIRPAAFSLMSLIVVPLAMAPLLYLVLPLPVSPSIAPVWALIMVLPLSALISNSQPIFGRN